MLGIDNIIFISILVGRVPVEQRDRLRRLGLLGALGTRLLLLFSLKWVMGLTTPLFTVASVEITGRALILLLGGLFLIGKSVREIHDKLEGDLHADLPASGTSRAFSLMLVQIMLVDVIFSLDSVITAVGMVDDLWVMVVAMILSMVVMLAAARSISEFVDRHPTIKILALSFLILIGVLLVADGLGQHVSKGYVYFAMAFSLVVEVLNMRYRKKATPAPTADSTATADSTTPA